jgi:hypothetical protein
MSVTDQLLEIDLQVLLIRHGRQRVLNVLARLGEQSVAQLEQELRVLAERPTVGKSNKDRLSLIDIAEAQARERPTIFEPLRAIAVNYENHVFLPYLRDVRRLLDRLGASDATAKSRASAGPVLIRALAKLTPEELLALSKRTGSPHESDYSLLSRAIMGSPPTQRHHG